MRFNCSVPGAPIRLAIRTSDAPSYYPVHCDSPVQSRSCTVEKLKPLTNASDESRELCECRLGRNLLFSTHPHGQDEDESVAKEYHKSLNCGYKLQDTPTFT